MSKKVHPADAAVMAGLADAQHWMVTLLADGVTHKFDNIPTLVQARAEAARIGEGAARRPMIFGIAPDGKAYLVPTGYDPEAVSRETPAPADAAEAPKAEAAPKAARKRPAKAAKAATAKKTPKPKKATGKAAKPGKAAPNSKTATAIKLCSRPGGATRAEIVKATEWPSINLKPIAKRHGMKLSEDKEGKLHMVSS